MNAPQSALYRTPRSPGFMGSYNWAATLFGLALLLLTSALATQYIAARFLYQPALGTPLLRTPTYSIYQPFAWAIWGWRYCTSKDPRIRGPLFQGEMIVFAGAVLSVVFFYIVAGRRARRLSKDAEDLHGSARWAEESDIDQILVGRFGVPALAEGEFDKVGVWLAGAGRRAPPGKQTGSESGDTSLAGFGGPPPQ